MTMAQDSRTNDVETATVRLWTYHPSVLRVDATDLRVDPTQGSCWHKDGPYFRYREMLPKLQELVRTSQFLWCFTVPEQFTRTSENHDVVEWELNVPVPQILRFLRVPVWEAILSGESDAWEDLFVTSNPEQGVDIQALVCVPLRPGTVRSLGAPTPQYSNAQLDYAKKVMEDSKDRPDYEFDIFDIDRLKRRGLPLSIRG
jgi:hypothetical protein